MNNYQKIFGSGPAGSLISLLLLVISIFLANHFSQFQISNSQFLRYSFFGGMCVITVFIITWSIHSLPPISRGNTLVTSGAFRYFRHPLYGAFLSFFNFGLALFLNNWIYVLWAALQHPVWHWIIKGEEKCMEKQFPGEYEEYSLRTGRFFPRVKTR